MFSGTGLAEAGAVGFPIGSGFLHRSVSAGGHVISLVGFPIGDNFWHRFAFGEAGERTVFPSGWFSNQI